MYGLDKNNITGLYNEMLHLDGQSEEEESSTLKLNNPGEHETAALETDIQNSRKLKEDIGGVLGLLDAAQEDAYNYPDSAIKSIERAITSLEGMLSVL